MCAKAKISFLLCGRSGRQMRWPLTSDSSAIPAANSVEQHTTVPEAESEAAAGVLCMQHATCNVQRADRGAAGHCSLSVQCVTTQRNADRHTMVYVLCCLYASH